VYLALLPLHVEDAQLDTQQSKEELYVRLPAPQLIVFFVRLQPQHVKYAKVDIFYQQPAESPVVPFHSVQFPIVPHAQEYQVAQHAKLDSASTMEHVSALAPLQTASSAQEVLAQHAIKTMSSAQDHAFFPVPRSLIVSPVFHLRFAPHVLLDTPCQLTTRHAT